MTRVVTSNHQPKRVPRKRNVHLMSASDTSSTLKAFNVPRSLSLSSPYSSLSPPQPAHPGATRTDGAVS